MEYSVAFTVELWGAYCGSFGENWLVLLHHCIREILMRKSEFCWCSWSVWIIMPCPLQFSNKAYLSSCSAWIRNHTYITLQNVIAHPCLNFNGGPGVGVTKAPFVNFSVSKIFDLAEVPVRLFVSHSYLTGVTAAELRQHLSNMNMIFNR